MRRLFSARTLVLSSALVVAVGMGSSPLVAQSLASGLDRPHFAVGYVADAPNLMGGAGAYVILPRTSGFGIYVDAKFDLESPSGYKEFEDGLTADDVVNQISGANFIQRESSAQSVNAAVMKVVSPFLALYVGGGLAKVKQYHWFQEAGGTLGVDGVFWVEAPNEEETRPNFMAGGFVRMSSFLSTQFGFETEPGGFTLGASFRLPRR